MSDPKKKLRVRVTLIAEYDLPVENYDPSIQGSADAMVRADWDQVDPAEFVSMLDTIRIADVAVPSGATAKPRVGQVWHDLSSSNRRVTILNIKGENAICISSITGRESSIPLQKFDQKKYALIQDAT